ncbi:MAG: hypothetical protein IT342_19005 [Candidatus Melainabacteria bacterium]|nr:hypothetical protein [Candidatus Melainabacteria bacterium]
MQISKYGALILSFGILAAAVPPTAWYLFSGTVTMSGDVVLSNGTPGNIWEHGSGCLALIMSFMIVIFSLTVAWLLGKRRKGRA